MAAGCFTWRILPSLSVTSRSCYKHMVAGCYNDMAAGCFTWRILPSLSAASSRVINIWLRGVTTIWLR
eukprot:259107-Prorocentrum_minimum.AAC.1